MESADYVHSGKRLITMGYCMDFNLKGIMKVMWIGRKEVTYNDLKGLVKISVKKFVGVVRPAFLKRGTKRPEIARSTQTNSASVPSA